MTWIEWIEPFGPKNEPVYCRVTPEVAIATARKSALTSPKHYEYTSDAEALEDFIIVHWASRVEMP